MCANAYICTCTGMLRAEAAGGISAGHAYIYIWMQGVPAPALQRCYMCNVHTWKHTYDVCLEGRVWHAPHRSRAAALAVRIPGLWPTCESVCAHAGDSFEFKAISCPSPPCRCKFIHTMLFLHSRLCALTSVHVQLAIQGVVSRRYHRCRLGVIGPI